jgi:hypothetical protein
MRIGAGWKRETKTAIRPHWKWIVTAMFALAIGTTSAGESVGTGSNGTTEPRGHGGRLIDTAGAKFSVVKVSVWFRRVSRKKHGSTPHGIGTRLALHLTSAKFASLLNTEAL